jgi:P-type conjugative transfer protein TrbL
MDMWGNNALDKIDVEFLNQFIAQSDKFVHAGINLGFWLAVISMITSVGIMLIRGEELHALVSKVIQQSLIFGLMFGLMQYGGEWIPKIINGFIYVGQQSSGLHSLSPSSIFNQGWYIAGSILESANKAGMFHLVSALTAVISGFFVILIYAFISASLCVLLIKAYALVLVGPMIFALGNLDYTKSAVSNYVQKIIGIGLNLVMFYLLVGVGIKLGNNWADLVRQGGALDLSILVVIVGGLTVFYLVMQNVPSFIATISGAGGFRDYGQATVASAMTGAGVMANAYMKAGGLSKGAIAGAGSVARGASSVGQGAWEGAKAGYNIGGSPISSKGGAFQSASTSNTSGLMKTSVQSVGKITGAVAGSMGGASEAMTKGSINKIADIFKGKRG